MGADLGSLERTNESLSGVNAAQELLLKAPARKSARLRADVLIVGTSLGHSANAPVMAVAPFGAGDCFARSVGRARQGRYIHRFRPEMFAKCRVAHTKP